MPSPRRLPRFLTMPEQKALAAQWRYLSAGVWKSWGQYQPMILKLGMDDAIGAGQLGLMEAAKRFDPGRGFKFCTYASYWIKQRMMREAQNTSLLVRLPIWIFKRDKKIKKRIAEDVDRALQPVGNLDFEGETMPDDVATAETNELIQARICELPERTQVVLRLRFWEGQTLRQVGTQLGLTRERIRQIEKGALEQLKFRLAA